MNWEKVIFLAHASEDKSQVWKLYRDLRGYGLEPWLDEEMLLPGTDWDMKIREAIQKSKIFLACLTKNSIKKDGYIQRELKLALTRMEEKPPNEVFFIPVLFEPLTVPEIKVGTVNINQYQYARLYEKDGFAKLIKTLENAMPIRFDEGVLDLSNIAKKITPPPEYILTKTEIKGDRIIVEMEKIKKSYSNFKYNSNDHYFEGTLKTIYGNEYNIRLVLPADYPISPPRILFANGSELKDCPHLYSDGSICVMNANQWSPNLSLAFVIAKTETWLNKCDVWKMSGYWPELGIQH